MKSDRESFGIFEDIAEEAPPDLRHIGGLRDWCSRYAVPLNAPVEEVRFKIHPSGVHHYGKRVSNHGFQCDLLLASLALSSRRNGCEVFPRVRRELRTFARSQRGVTVTICDHFHLVTGQTYRDHGRSRQSPLASVACRRIQAGNSPTNEPAQSDTSAPPKNKYKR